MDVSFDDRLVYRTQNHTRAKSTSIHSLLTVPVSAVGQLVTVPAAKPQSPLPPAAFATDPPAPFELDHKLEVEPS